MDNVIITLKERNVLEFIKAAILAKEPNADLNNLPSKIDAIKPDSVEFTTNSDHAEETRWVWYFDGDLEFESLPEWNEEDHNGKPPYFFAIYMYLHKPMVSDHNVCYGCQNNCKGDIPNDCVPQPEDRPENTWEGNVEMSDDMIDTIESLREEI